MDMTKPKMGRPPKDPADVANYTVQFRLTAAERALIYRAAALLDLSISDWSRVVLLNKARLNIQRFEKNSD